MPALRVTYFWKSLSSWAAVVLCSMVRGVMSWPDLLIFFCDGSMAGAGEGFQPCLLVLLPMVLFAPVMV